METDGGATIFVKLLRIAQNIMHNREDAEDAVQEAFFKAYKRLGQFQESAEFSTWLIRIVLNEISDETAQMAYGSGRFTLRLLPKTMRDCPEGTGRLVDWPSVRAV